MEKAIGRDQMFERPRERVVELDKDPGVMGVSS